MKKDETEKIGNENEIKRWTAKRKSAVVLEIIKGLTTPAEVSRKHGLTVSEVEEWVDGFIKGGQEQLRSRPRDLQELHEVEKKELYAKIGELTLEKDILKKVHRILGKDIPEGIS